MKNIPLYKLTIEDENTIPAKPDVIYEKPNDKHYEKVIKEFNDKILYHKNSLHELKESIDKEKFGNNPEIDRLKKIKDELSAKLEPLSAELKEARDLCNGPNEELRSLRALKSQLTNELEITDIEFHNEEIKRIQKKLGFGTLNAPEEKKLIEKKNKLEDQKPKIEKLNATKKRINELYTKYGPHLKKITELTVQVKELYGKKKDVSSKLKIQFENKTSSDPAIKNLQFQIESITQEITKLKNQILEIENEWNEKWYNYENQQKLLDYINEATKKITLIKKKTRKRSKKKRKS